MYKSPLELTLILHYGPYVPAGKAADLLSFPSLQALIAARRRGRLPFALCRLDGRRGWFARTSDISRWIESVDPDTSTNASTRQNL
jgi:hypothetical protein